MTTLEKQGVPIKNAYLFGSWAKGTEHKDSDIDLAIISPSFRTWEKKADKLSHAMRMDFSMIESHGFHPKQFNTQTNPVAYEIKKYGIKII
ncbi:MAG: nucleotidyltransferase domain-containing protein [Patescibacteria group bacterium]